MSKERIKISEDLYDIMPSDYQDLVKSATYGKEDRGWKDIGNSKELIYAMTSRHVTGEAGEVLFTVAGGKQVRLGRTAAKQLGRIDFERAYESLTGKNITINLDVGLIALEDQRLWNASIYGIGSIGPLADLSVYNLSLNLIGAPVRAHGAASGVLEGRIAALFYRYKSVGGLEYVADFLIGGRGDKTLATHPGDSGTVWVMASRGFVTTIRMQLGE